MNKYIKLFESDKFKDYIDDIFLDIQDKYRDNEDISIDIKPKDLSIYNSSTNRVENRKGILIWIEISTWKIPYTFDEFDLHIQDLETILDITKLIKNKLKVIERSGYEFELSRELKLSSYDIEIKVYKK